MGIVSKNLLKSDTEYMVGKFIYILCMYIYIYLYIYIYIYNCEVSCFAIYINIYIYISGVELPTSPLVHTLVKIRAD